MLKWIEATGRSEDAAVQNALAQLGLDFTWFAFPISEVISGGVGLLLYRRVVRQWQRAAQ